MTDAQINNIVNQAAQRVADMFTVNHEYVSAREKIEYLDEVCAEISEAPRLMRAVISPRVRLLVGDEVYESVFPKVIYK